MSNEIKPDPSLLPVEQPTEDSKLIARFIELIRWREENNRPDVTISLTEAKRLRSLLDANNRAGVEQGRREPLDLLQEVYDFYMGPQACGDFTCNCGKPDICGICEIRERVKKEIAARATARPSLDRKFAESLAKQINDQLLYALNPAVVVKLADLIEANIAASSPTLPPPLGLNLKVPD